MNNNAKAWIKALRSGEYKQGIVVLRNERDEYCCLGVACDLYCKNVKDIYDPITIKYGGNSSYLPAQVAKWIGLRDTLGKFDCGQRSLASFNDFGTTFSEIADIIESEPEGLFAS